MSPENITPESLNNSRGRPCKSFAEGCERTKRRRVEELVLNHSAEELSRALELTNFLPNKDSSANVELVKDDSPKINKMLAMYMDLGLTRRKYNKFKT